MDKNILSTVGNTPLVRLTRVLGDVPFRLYAKLEAFNPGGSIKDRAALSIIENAMRRNEIGPETTIVESSSGNMGIGLAQACAYFGLRFICVVDPKTTRQNIDILKSFGAEIDLVAEPDPETGEFLQARINRVRAILKATRNSFWPDQYSNIYNALGQQRTMQEIAAEMGGKVDYLFCATSTCGTIRGCSEYIREHGMGTRIIAVDAVGSVIFSGKPAKRLIPGHGAAVRPKLYQSDLADRCIHVSDLECVVGCRRLVKSEAILAGGSSGAVLMAVEKMSRDIIPESNCVLILCDRGERYLDTIYSDDWVTEHFGDVSYRWQQVKEDSAWVTTTY